MQGIGPADVHRMGNVRSAGRGEWDGRRRDSLLEQKDPSGKHEWPIVYASRTTSEDGAFLTERILRHREFLKA